MEMGRNLRVLCPVNLQKDDGVIWLLGASSLPLTILSAVRCLHYNDKTAEPEIGEEAEELRVLIPKGLEIVGAILISDGAAGECSKRAGEFAVKMQSSFLGQSSASGKSAQVVAGSAIPGNGHIKYSLYLPGDLPELESLELEQDVEKIRDSLWTHLSLFRCQMELTIPLYLSSNSSAEDFKRQLVDAVEHLMGDLKSTRVILLAQGSVVKSKSQGVVLIQPFNQLKADDSAHAKDSIQHASLCSDLSSPPSFYSTTSGMQLPEPVEVTVMLQQSGISTDRVAAAPVVQYLPAAEITDTVKMLKLSMAVVCMGGSHELLVDAATELVLPALRDQLAAMHRAVSKKASHTNVDVAKVCAYQFCPNGWLHPLTAIYDLTKGELERDLVEARRALHRRLGLSLDRPLLRSANAITFKNLDETMPRSGGKRLTDTHVGLPYSGVPGGQQSLVDGSYEYYHYLQDRFDDNGWGCAYRSLQTIISWFRLQQYTTVAVPSHKDVQQTLVDIEDKEPSFVGSKEWIGAIEISFVLDKLLGVSCKILNARTGADIPTFCRELALHFQVQGTPVMIGGGVLAYTLLGVDYNELTGESAFLILDPHYTGGEDLRTIRNGGWCGWKRPVTDSGHNFFLHNKFYNLLLPQRPNTV